MHVRCIVGDAEFQKLLHWGIYPQIPCPGNDHGCPYGTPKERKIYEMVAEGTVPCTKVTGRSAAARMRSR